MYYTVKQLGLAVIVKYRLAQYDMVMGTSYRSVMFNAYVRPLVFGLELVPSYVGVFFSACRLINAKPYAREGILSV